MLCIGYVANTEESKLTFRNLKEIHVKIKFAHISLKMPKKFKMAMYFECFKEIQAKIKFAHILLKYKNEYVILSSRLGGMIWKRH